MASHPHSIPVPAPRPRVQVIAKRVAIAFAALWRARAHRREVAELLRLDDYMLKDIGLVRSDVLGALEERATADPSVGLRLRSVENRLRQNDRDAQVERLMRRPAGSVAKAA